MNGNADLECLLAIDLHGLNSARDHSFRDVLATNAGDFYFFAAADASYARRVQRELR